VVTPFAETLDSITSAAHACTGAGLVTICAFPAYKRAERDKVRAAVSGERFIEVFVDTDPALCRQRRPDASHDGFEAPSKPDVTLKLDSLRMHQAIDDIVDAIAARGLFDAV
jgi:adenylylsulfate kinase-like enzyme